jgi:hypothetical protein
VFSCHLTPPLKSLKGGFLLADHPYGIHRRKKAPAWKRRVRSDLLSSTNCRPELVVFANRGAS